MAQQVQDFSSVLEREVDKAPIRQPRNVDEWRWVAARQLASFATDWDRYEEAVTMILKHEDEGDYGDDRYGTAGTPPRPSKPLRWWKASEGIRFVPVALLAALVGTFSMYEMNKSANHIQRERQALCQRENAKRETLRELVRLTNPNESVRSLDIC